MLFKTRGIVLSHIKYKESSIICKVFTEEFGLQSYIINSVRSKSSKNKIAYFQPFTLLDLVVYKHPKKEIQRISDYKPYYNATDLPYNIFKTTIALFLSEILAKCSSSEENQHELFNFISNFVQQFDQNTEESSSSFHVLFLYHYLQITGYVANPIQVQEEMTDFHIGYKNIATSLSSLLDQNLLTNKERRECLNCLLDYFRLNVGLPQLKSLTILQELYQ